jgi:hypothetical protein
VALARRVLADQRIFVRRAHHLGEVAGTGDVAGGETGRVDEVGFGHAERVRLGVHRRDEGFGAAGIGAAERGGGAILGRHQREDQQLVARQDRAGLDARARALLRVHVFARDDDARVEVEAAVDDHHRGHQLGDRGDRRHGIRVLADDDFIGRGVLHQRRRRAEINGFLSARAFGLCEADRQREYEKEGEDCDDALQRMQCPLHLR